MIYVVDIESIPTRYTSQWKEWIPNALKNANKEFMVIDGEQDDSEKKIGKEAFFDFNQTAKYKAKQIQKIADLFSDGDVKDGDVFLFTDAWHPGVIQLRQMMLFSDVDVKIFGMWHAGSYDPADLLGQRGREYFLSFEKSLYDSLDYSFFATEFSKSLLVDTLGVESYKGRATGFPYNLETLEGFKIPFEKKEDIILFPHRISSEKHPELFDELSERFPKFEFIKTLDVCPDKKSFYELMDRSKYIISFAEQETWGISVFEALMLDSIPIVPNKLSYREMYSDSIKYDWDDEDITKNVDKVEDKILEIEALNTQNKKSIIDENVKRLYSFCGFDKIISYL